MLAVCRATLPFFGCSLVQRLDVLVQVGLLPYDLAEGLYFLLQ